MKKLLETYLPDGPTMPLPTTSMHPTYLEHLKNKDKEDIKLCDVKKFQSLIGLLLQLLEVRPDIAFALSKLGQQQKQPTEEDYSALMHITNYLYGTKYWGVGLKQGNGETICCRGNVKKKGKNV